MKCNECTHKDGQDYAWVTCTLRASLRDSYGPPVCKHDPDIEKLEDLFRKDNSELGKQLLIDDPDISAYEYNRRMNDE